MMINYCDENKINFIKINQENLNLACEVQNKIFPEEDARQNFIEQINKDPYRKEMDYYIVYEHIESYIQDTQIPIYRSLSQCYRESSNLRIVCLPLVYASIPRILGSN